MMRYDCRAKNDKPLFISYARANGDFAQKLYFDLQSLDFKLWRDRSEMEIGRDWWQQIQEAIRECETMVLCMSPQALESKVVAQEWHYARQVGTRVMPVIAADIDFNIVPRWMKRVDWADFREMASEHELVWERFIQQLNTPFAPPHVPFMVEPLPPDFVPRPNELKPLITALVDEIQGATAVTVGLIGAGAYGKTTLARATCHEMQVRGAFDDGILWISLGEAPGDLLGRMLDLIEKLTGVRPGFNTLAAAQAEYQEILAERYVLIVIDDVWSSTHLEPFLQGGKNCAYLITTRNSDTLPATAFKQSIAAMSATEAIALLGWGLSFTQEEVLHPLAKRLGAWPLLLRLANGVLRDNVESGEAYVEAIRYINASLDELGLTAFDSSDDQESRSKAVEATLGVSLKRLNEEERKRYNELAIFPNDADIPLKTLEQYWKATANYTSVLTRRLCERFAKMSLLVQFDLSTRTIRQHDVIRAYLREKQQANQLLELNRQFLETYSLPHWYEMPDDEPYLIDHLAFHLLEARRTDELKGLFASQDWLRLRVSRQDYRYDGYLADLTVAWEQDAHITSMQEIHADIPLHHAADCLRYALLSTSISSITHNYPPKLIVRAVETGVWTTKRVLSIITSMIYPGQKAELCALLLETAKFDGQQRDYLQTEGTKAAFSIESLIPRWEALAHFLPIDEDLRAAVASEGFEHIFRLESLSDRAQAVIALVPFLEDDQLYSAFEALFSTTNEATYYVDEVEFWARALVALASRFESSTKFQALALGLQEVFSLESKWQLVRSLRAFVPHVEGELFDIMLQKVEQEVRADLEITSSTENQDLMIGHLVMSGQMDEALAKELALSLEARETLFSNDSSRPIGHREEVEWTQVLVAIADRLEGEEKGIVLTYAFATAFATQYAGDRVTAIVALAPHLEGNVKSWVLAHAREAALVISVARNRAEACAALAAHAEGILKQQLLTDGVAAVEATGYEDPQFPSREDSQRAGAIQALAPYLEGELLMHALDLSLALRDEGMYGYRSDALAAFAPQLDEAMLIRVLANAQKLDDEQYQVRALCALAARLPEQHRQAIVRQALRLTGSISNFFTRGTLLIELASVLDDDLLRDGVQAALGLEVAEMRALTLTALANGRREVIRRELLSQAFEAVQEIVNIQSKAYLLSELALEAEGDLLPHILQCAIDLDYNEFYAIPLTTLLPKLEGDLLKQGLKKAFSLQEKDNKTLTLSVLSVTLSSDRLTAEDTAALSRYTRGKTLARAIEVAQTHLDDFFQSYTLASFISQMDMMTLKRVFQDSLIRSASASRIELLSKLAAHMDEPTKAELLSPQGEDEDNALVLTALAPHLTGKQIEKGMNAALSLSDHWYRLRASIAFLPVVPDQRKLLALIRQDVIDYLLSVKSRDRLYILALCAEKQLVAEPIFSKESILIIANYILEVCGEWQWWQTR